MLKKPAAEFLSVGPGEDGVSTGPFVWLGLACCAIVFTFVYLCVAGYAWLSISLGPVFGGLANGRCLPPDCRHRRRRIRNFTTAHSCNAPFWSARRKAPIRRQPRFTDPRMLNVVMQAGRAVGWQRLVPLALLAFLSPSSAASAPEERAARKLKSSRGCRDAGTSTDLSAMFSSAPSGCRSGVAVIGFDNLLEPAIRQSAGPPRTPQPPQLGPLRLGMVRRLNRRGPPRAVPAR